MRKVSKAVTVQLLHAREDEIVVVVELLVYPTRQMISNRLRGHDNRWARTRCCNRSVVCGH